MSERALSRSVARQRSLARRAVLLVLLAELVCALVFSVVALVHETRSRRHAFDVMLRGRADSLLGAIQDAEDPEDNVTVDSRELHVPPEDVYAVYNLGGRMLGSSPGAPPALIDRAGDGIRSVVWQGKRYRLIQMDALRIIDRDETHGVGIGRPVTILYAARTEEMRRQVTRAAGYYSLLSAVVLCVTALLLISLLRRLLEPLHELAIAAEAVDAGSVEFAPPPSALAVAELRPLAEALTGTLQRLRHAMEVEQRFVGDAAHELKTAVAVERSSLQLLSMRERSPDEYRAGLEQLLIDNERLEQLVGRMLILGRMEDRARTLLAPDATADMRLVIERTVRRLQPFLEDRGLSTDCVLENLVWPALDDDAAETLVSNLVMNAAQHSPRNRRIEVTLHRDTQEPQRGVFQVRDWGEGISPESLPHVFERFYREDRSRSRETGGAGLGLAICKSIVESAGGEIAIESAPGLGTAVTVQFPAR